MLAALSEEQAGWPGVWKACLTDIVIQLQGDGGGTGGRVHWQVELAPVGVSAFLAVEKRDEVVYSTWAEALGTARDVSSLPVPRTVLEATAKELAADELIPPHLGPNSTREFQPQGDAPARIRLIADRRHDAHWFQTRNARPVRIP